MEDTIWRGGGVGFYFINYVSWAGICSGFIQHFLHHFLNPKLTVSEDLIDFRETMHDKLVTPWSSPRWEANSMSAGQEILHILWNPKVLYRVYENLPPVLAPSQVIMPRPPPHTISWRSFWYYPPNPRLGLSSGFSSWGFSTKTLHASLFSRICPTCHMPRPSHPSWFDYPHIVWWDVRKLSHNNRM